MAWCRTCGTEGAGEVCSICGTPYPHASLGQPTPVDVGDTLVAPAESWPPAAPGGWGQPQGPTGQQYPPGGPAPQWNAVPPPSLQPQPPHRRKLGWGLAAGAAVIVIGVGAALLGPRLLGAAGATPATPGIPPATSTTSATSTTTPDATPTLARPATVAPAAPAAPAGPAVTVTTTVVRPAGPDALADTYVVVLESLDKSTVTLAEARAKAATLASASGRAPKVLDSSATAGMNPGYWAIVDGPHASESAARASCSAYGRTQGTGECYLRVLG